MRICWTIQDIDPIIHQGLFIWYRQFYYVLHWMFIITQSQSNPILFVTCTIQWVFAVSLGNPLHEKHEAEGDWRQLVEGKLPRLKKLDGTYDLTCNLLSLCLYCIKCKKLQTACQVTFSDKINWSMNILFSVDVI